MPEAAEAVGVGRIVSIDCAVTRDAAAARRRAVICIVGDSVVEGINPKD